MCTALSKGYFYRCEEARNTTLQRPLTLQNAFRNKEETIGYYTEFVLEACVAHVRQEECVIHLCACF